MKKIFLIFGLLILNSCATLESPVSTGMSKQNYCMAKNLGAIAAICNSRYYYYENGMEVLKKGNTYAVFKNVTQPTTSNFFENNFGNGTFVAEVHSWADVQNLLGKRGSINNNSNSNDSITFDIKQKKEQCSAIGFKPETEKYADCVLRLVELDVKQQTQNQIVSAQNSGNEALVRQLERQNNIESSKALLDLGQQLMQPKQNNSNIYLPQTRRCTVQGFGTFSNVTCR